MLFTRARWVISWTATVSITSSQCSSFSRSLPSTPSDSSLLRVKAAKRYSHMIMCSRAEASDRTETRSSLLWILIRWVPEASQAESSESLNEGNLPHDKHGAVGVADDTGRDATEHHLRETRCGRPCT